VSASSTRSAGSAVAEPEPEVAPATAVRPRRLRTVALTAGLVVLLDQATKSWAVSKLSDGHVIDLVGSLRFNLAFNEGAAFSVGDGWNLGPWIAVLALVVVSTLVFTGPTARSQFGAVAIGLVAGGALGNLIDRAVRNGSGFMGGRVVDWIDVQWWPVFNVADAAVSCGAVALVLYSLKAPQD
jgi:signal peptidase II